MSITNNKKSNNVEDEINSITLEIKGLLVENLKINEAGQYNVKLQQQINFNEFAKIITNTNRIFKNEKKIDVLINNLSIKRYKIASKYLQQNCLILSINGFLNDNLSVEENIKLVSTMFSGFDLSSAVISSFNLKDIKNKKVKELNRIERKFLILSYCVACPALIWFIDNNLLINLSQYEKNIFNNAVKIRIKQGGVVVILC